MEARGERLIDCHQLIWSFSQNGELNLTDNLTPPIRLLDGGVCSEGCHTPLHKKVVPPQTLEQEYTT